MAADAGLGSAGHTAHHVLCQESATELLLELDMYQETEAWKVLRSKGKSNRRVWRPIVRPWVTTRCNRNPPKAVSASVLVSAKACVKWDAELVRPTQITFRLTQK